MVKEKQIDIDAIADEELKDPNSIFSRLLSGLNESVMESSNSTLGKAYKDLCDNADKPGHAERLAAFNKLHDEEFANYEKEEEAKRGK